ncbi:ABC-type polar amino acid transport system ATPase subunit [Variovorax guangxiensis]|nr:ABC-type polar amino acid transport system ATPase subunit [Variovorax guangxiensis]
MTMMCVTHEMNFAREVADRVWFTDQGRLVEIAKPDDFFSNPASERARKFLIELRELSSRASKLVPGRAPPF